MIEILDVPISDGIPVNFDQLLSLFNRIPDEKLQDKASVWFDDLLKASIIELPIIHELVPIGVTPLKFYQNNVSGVETKVKLWNLFARRLTGVYPWGKLDTGQIWKLRITFYPGIKIQTENQQRQVMEMVNELQAYVGPVLTWEYERFDKFSFLSILFMTAQLPETIPINEFLYVNDTIASGFSWVLGTDLFFVRQASKQDEIEATKPISTGEVVSSVMGYLAILGLGLAVVFLIMKR